jgi:hypothetical protein
MTLQRTVPEIAMFFKGLLFIITLGSGGTAASGVFASCADLALVLAIDGSGSINDRDFSLQQDGYAAAFRDPRVQSALASAGVADVAVVLWGDASMAPQILPWHRLVSPEDAVRLAQDLSDMPRRVTGDTGIGSGLWTALDLLEEGQSCALRRIINVSGDGVESFGARPVRQVSLAVARDRAKAMAVTINGLAITTEDDQLQDWYRARVISGPEAFVMTAASFEAFGEAIIRKLSREITLPVLAAADPGQEQVP